MAYFDRSSSKSADAEPVGAAALRGSGVPVATPAGPAARPPPVRRDPATKAAPPAPAPFDSPSSVAHVSVDRQVATLQQAAREGTPFCEECAKPAP